MSFFPSQNTLKSCGLELRPRPLGSFTLLLRTPSWFHASRQDGVEGEGKKSGKGIPGIGEGDGENRARVVNGMEIAPWLL